MKEKKKVIYGIALYAYYFGVIYFLGTLMMLNSFADRFFQVIVLGALILVTFERFIVHHRLFLKESDENAVLGSIDPEKIE